MAFQSLNQVLGALKLQALTPEQQQFYSLLECWPSLVGKMASQQTRPLSIGRGVLYIATSSATLAQDLTFKRSQILKKLNQQLPCPLNDIKFSTAQWQGQSQHQGTHSTTSSDEMTSLWQNHPSAVPSPNISSSPPPSKPRTPLSAFQSWAKQVQLRSQDFPLCPRCQSPTPPGELHRWSVCSICMTQERVDG